MTIADWLRQAQEDAEQRGLQPLKPMLEALARSTTELRRAARERLAPSADDTRDAGR